MRYIGRKISVGFGKETSRGTAIAASAWFPRTDLDFEDRFEQVVQEGALGNITDSNDGIVTKTFADGSIEGDFQIENSGLLLLAALGQVASVETVGTGAYDHTFTLANTNQHQSLTVVTEEENGDFAFGLAMLEELKISGTQGEIVKISATFTSKKGVTTTATTDFIDTDKTLLARHAIVSIGGVELASKSFEITFKKNLLVDFRTGSEEVYDILNQQFEATGTVEFAFDDNTFKNYALEGEKKEVKIVIQDTNTTIGVSDNPTFSVTLPKCSFTNWDRSKANNDIIDQTLDFKAHYDITTSTIGSVLLRNETTGY